VLLLLGTSFKPLWATSGASARCFSARFWRPHRTFPRAILFPRKLLKLMLPHGIYPRVGHVWDVFLLLGTSFKPLWATSGASARCFSSRFWRQHRTLARAILFLWILLGPYREPLPAICFHIKMNPNHYLPCLALAWPAWLALPGRRCLALPGWIQKNQ
jgi:hypothetical protein